jgi:hypothetical protein
MYTIMSIVKCNLDSICKFMDLQKKKEKSKLKTEVVVDFFNKQSLLFLYMDGGIRIVSTLFWSRCSKRNVEESF